MPPFRGGSRDPAFDPMTNPPIISVVMAVFNGARTLDRSVRSILDQTFEDFEFLIVDDGSTDETAALLEAHGRRDSRIRIISQPNAGLTRALINGCSASRGGWIARQDDDDWSEPDRFEKCLAFAERHPECSMIASWADYRGPGGEILEVVQRPADVLSATEGLMRSGMGPPAHGSVMFRKSDYEEAGGYRPEFYFGQDSDLWLRMGGRGKIGCVQEILYHYTLSPAAISGRFAGTQRQFGDLGHLCHVARSRGEPELPFLAEAAALTSATRNKKSPPPVRSQAGTNYRIGVQLARRRDPAAGRYFREALRLDPLHWRALVRLALHALKK